MLFNKLRDIIHLTPIANNNPLDFRPILQCQCYF